MTDDRGQTTATLERPGAGMPRLCDEELIEQLQAEPELCLHLKEAFAGGRWLVTVHRKVKDAPPDDLQGRAVHHDFPITDAPEALQAICKALLADAGAAIERPAGRVMDIRNWR